MTTRVFQVRNDRDAWESYWQQVTASASTRPPWDWGSAEPMVSYLTTLVDSYSPDLPLVDVGRGDGILTRALAESFPRVIGVDISASAITEAQRNRAAANIEYQQLDLTDLNGVAALHDRLGETRTCTCAACCMRSRQRADQQRSRP